MRVRASGRETKGGKRERAGRGRESTDESREREKVGKIKMESKVKGGKDTGRENKKKGEKKKRVKKR